MSHMPTPAAVADMLTDLVGRDVTARTGAAAALAPGKSVVAVYRDASEALKAVACCDIATGGSLGAALTVMPPGIVEDSQKAGRVDEGLTENLYEVFNVLSAVFPKAGMPRLILRSVHHDAQLAPDVAAMLAKPGHRLDMDVNVAGYRPGKMTIATV